MAIKAVSQLPDPIQPLADGDLLFLTQYDAENDQYVSVQLPLGNLKVYVSGGPVPIGCAGATNSLAVIVDQIWEFKVDENATLNINYPMAGGLTNLKSYLQLYGCDAEVVTDDIDYLRIFNTSTSYHKVFIVATDAGMGTVSDANDNPTLEPNTGTSFEFSACLAPA